MAALALSDSGTIRDCNHAAEHLFDYGREELIDRHVSLVLPGLAQESALARGGSVDPRLAYLSRVGLFNARRRGGEGFVCQVCFSSLGNAGRPPLLAIIRSVDAPTRPGR